jgi:hypothetical protein
MNKGERAGMQLRQERGASVTPTDFGKIDFVKFITIADATRPSVNPRALKAYVKKWIGDGYGLVPVATTAVAAATTATTTEATATTPTTTEATTAATPTTSTAVATTATTSATTTEAATALFARAGFVDGQGATVVLLAIEGSDRGLGLVVVAHFDEPETLAAAGVPVVDDLGGCDRPICAEELFQLGAVNTIGQITDVQLLTHWDLLMNG